jgi:hypothetical protein
LSECTNVTVASSRMQVTTYHVLHASRTRAEPRGVVAKRPGRFREALISSDDWQEH